MTFTYDVDIDMVMMNHHAVYLRQMSFHLRVTLKDTQTLKQLQHLNHYSG